MNIKSAFSTAKKSVLDVANTTQQALSSSPATKIVCASMVCGIAAIISPEVAAWSAPASGSFAYDIYDIGVNKLLKGPIGFVAGVAIIAYSASNFSQGPWKAVTGILMGSGMAKADTITSSMGAMIDGAEHLSKLADFVK
ncbi:TPA: hypothetical protein RQO57_003562 [Aeromonas dhakensis]|uniref:hypothetical protein n=1 Tax=Aeromonas dhakensis TaxID=196024 RepID=UPI00288ECBFD|nr:hypothetical protein [Aeromonas dhakensis]